MNESNPGVNAWHVIVRLFNNYWIRLSHDVKKKSFININIINISYNMNNIINIIIFIYF